MPEKSLVVVMCENQTEKEKIFRKVCDQKIIPSEKMEILGDKPIRVPYSLLLEYPPIIVLNVPEDVDANVFYIIKREKYTLQHQFTGHYCKVDDSELSSEN